MSDNELFLTQYNINSKQPFGLKFIENSNEVVEQTIDPEGKPMPTSYPTGTTKSTSRPPNGVDAQVDVDF